MRRLPGFTLIELLIVVAIVAILAAIAIPNFLDAQVRAKVSRARADMRTLRVGIEAYAVDQNAYPRFSWGASPWPNDWYEGQGFEPTPISVTLGHWLTTPIAYASRFDIKPPFAPGRGGRSVVELALYQYIQPTFGRALQQRLHEFANPLLNHMDYYEACYGAYGLSCEGPQNINLSTPAEEIWHYPVPYDPTNGTVSHGYLVASQKHTDVDTPPLPP